MKQGPRFYDLRRTRATLLIAAGAHAKLVQEGLGHSSMTTTINLCGHVLPSTEAALSMRSTRSTRSATGAMLRRTRREVERARGLK
jgi:integrase